MSRAPAWERLRAATGTPLVVRPPERVRLDVARIHDGELPAVAGATVIHAWAADGGYELWAARITSGVADTYRIRAAALDVRASDAALARLLGFDPERPPAGVTWEWLPATDPARTSNELICPCEGIMRSQVDDAVRAGARSVDAVKRATKATFGLCQARLCADEIAGIIGLESDDPRAAITPRPPLVPVPGSVLAAFASAAAATDGA